MNEKLLKYLSYCAGIICLSAFISIRFLVLFNLGLKEDVVPKYWDRTKYGELFYFSHILHFREKGIPPAQDKFEHSVKHASVEECDILTFGDSFFEFSRHKQFPERIADDFHKKVHYVNNDHPLDYLASNHYSGKKPKLVVFERVERYLPVAFEKEHVENKAVQDESSKLSHLFEYIMEKLFYPRSEELYDVMLKRSYLTTFCYSAISTIKFDLFGYISKMTPKYLKDGENSWLFYHDEVNDDKTSFYYNHSQDTTDSICNNMKNLADRLQKDYNMTVVYLPLPAKYTLYHYVINDDEYNNFLPRLYNGLDSLGVKHVKVLDEFMYNDTLLYYRTDGHWNQKGIDIAYNKTIDFIRSDSTLYQFLR